MTSFFAKLDDRGTVELTGPDARPFLQGQTTCNVETLSGERSLPGAYCTPQGRMVCDFRLLQLQEDRLLLLMPSDVIPAAVGTFGKYIVFSRAKLQDRSDDWAQFAVWGPEALDRIGAPAREPGYCWRDGDTLWTIVEDAGAAEACAPRDDAARLAERLANRLGAGLSLASDGDYRRHEIERGIGHVYGPTVETFLPQMLNYQLTGRVSFNKGCYTGQEVVARMHYRGKLKRAMLIASADNATAMPGDPLTIEENSQAVGHVVSAEPDTDGSLKLLVVLALDARNQQVHLGEDGPLLSFPAMPYPLGDDAADQG